MADVCLTMTEEGTFKLPARLRRKYGLTAGAKLTVMDFDRFLLVTPGASRVTELAKKIESERKAAGLTVKDLLKDMGEIRRQVYQERYGTKR
ncbi:MAG: hypothetical protein HY318_12250 [Armatimonadetes bacterium]|nr:hypothetical protein [Armatimonadota bacterium]